MSEWYVSSVANLALPQFAISTGYVIGNIVRRITPTANANGAFRCTTAGTSAGSEPTWPTTNNGTVTSGTAVFTNVTGQSTYNWTAPAGDLGTLTGLTWTTRVVGGDNVYLSSDHSETATSLILLGSVTAGFSEVRVISVNRAGTVPPVAADIQSGAAFTSSSTTLTFNNAVPVYWSGTTFSSTTAMNCSSSFVKTLYLKNCALIIGTGGSTSVRLATSNPARITFDNTTLQFSNASQGIGTTSYSFDITWINTASALVSGTLPTTLCLASASGGHTFTCRGVDLSALTSGKNLVANSTSGTKALFDSCKINSAVTRFSTTSITAMQDEVELVNCYDGTNIINERYNASGTLTTERTIVLSTGDGGANDDVGLFSHKLVSTANSNTYSMPLYSFWLDVEYTTLNSSKTATVEIISSTTLTNADIYLLLEYQGTSSSSVASFANSLPTTPLTTATNLTSSSVTWNSSPATPQKQKLTVTFTPLVAGRVRGIVALARASTTVYVNPVVQIT